MKLKIKDLDYVKKVGQQSRTISTHSPVLSKKLGQCQLSDVDNSASKRSSADKQLLEPTNLTHTVQKVLMHAVTEI